MGFLTKYGVRFIAVAIAIAAVFLAGAMWSNQKHAQREADFEREKTIAIAEAVKERDKAHRIALMEEKQARDSLIADLEALGDREVELLERIETAELTRPASEIIIERVVERDGECEIIGNPFTDDFVKLWNDASRPN
jgi:hypothetical protein